MLSVFSTEVDQMKTLKGLALQDILIEVHSFVHRFGHVSFIR